MYLPGHRNSHNRLNARCESSAKHLSRELLPGDEDAFKRFCLTRKQTRRVGQTLTLPNR
jgi:hypothetical protein